MFITTYIVVYLTFSKLIIERLKPIYKTIHNKGMQEGLFEENIEDKDVINLVKDDVIDWAKKQANEIERLKEIENYRKEFLGNVSHELKTPVFNIQGYVLTLLDGGLYDESINKKYLQRAEKSINRLISIIDDLETISYLEHGRLNINFEAFDLCALIDEVLENYDDKARKKSISLINEVKQKRSVMVRGERSRIYQVFGNLVSNAINYGKEGGHVIIRSYDMDKHILIEVEDNGIGIPKDSLSRIFERFYRVDKSRSREQGGTGLGLAIVKHILDAHGQKINVKSEYGKGTSFTFTLEKNYK
ncbi:MAG: ATP-binding protein [Marinilabiliales bacterium]